MIIQLFTALVLTFIVLALTLGLSIPALCALLTLLRMNYANVTAWGYPTGFT